MSWDKNHQVLKEELSLNSDLISRISKFFDETNEEDEETGQNADQLSNQLAEDDSHMQENSLYFENMDKGNNFTKSPLSYCSSSDSLCPESELDCNSVSTDLIQPQYLKKSTTKVGKFKMKKDIVKQRARKEKTRRTLERKRKEAEERAKRVADAFELTKERARRIQTAKVAQQREEYVKSLAEKMRIQEQLEQVEKIRLQNLKRSLHLNLSKEGSNSKCNCNSDQACTCNTLAWSFKGSPRINPKTKFLNKNTESLYSDNLSCDSYDATFPNSKETDDLVYFPSQFPFLQKLLDRQRKIFDAKRELHKRAKKKRQQITAKENKKQEEEEIRQKINKALDAQLEKNSKREQNIIALTAKRRELEMLIVQIKGEEEQIKKIRIQKSKLLANPKLVQNTDDQITQVEERNIDLTYEKIEENREAEFQPSDKLIKKDNDFNYLLEILIEEQYNKIFY